MKLTIDEVAHIPLIGVEHISPVLLRFTIPANYSSHYTFAEFISGEMSKIEAGEYSSFATHFNEYFKELAEIKTVSDALSFNFRCIREAVCFLTNGQKAYSIFADKGVFYAVPHQSLYGMLSFLVYSPFSFSLVKGRVQSFPSQKLAEMEAIQELRSFSGYALSAIKGDEEELAFVVPQDTLEWFISFRGKTVWNVKNDNPWITGHAASLQAPLKDGFRLKTCANCQSFSYNNMSNMHRDASRGWVGDCAKGRGYVSLIGVCQEFS